MKILVYGAGVIGCIYAARLYTAGCNVTLLARGKRYAILKQQGLILRNMLTGKETISRPPLVQQLRSDDLFDLIIVTVRLNQIDGIIPVLKKNKSTPSVMFMMNYPDSVKQIVQQLSPKHVLLGFPGVGGMYRDNSIDYIQVDQQRTTIGKRKEDNSILPEKIRALLENAGFKTAVSEDMQAWLKIHAVFMTCACASIIKENGSSIQLSKNKKGVKRMILSIREGFTACSKLGIPVIPRNLKTIFMTMPLWFSVWYWQKAMRGRTGKLAIAPHAHAAMDEMQIIAEKVLKIVHSSSFPTPVLDELLTSFINSK